MYIIPLIMRGSIYISIIIIGPASRLMMETCGVDYLKTGGEDNKGQMVSVRIVSDLVTPLVPKQFNVDVFLEPSLLFYSLDLLKRVRLVNTTLVIATLPSMRHWKIAAPGIPDDNTLSSTP